MRSFVPNIKCECKKAMSTFLYSCPERITIKSKLFCAKRLAFLHYNRNSLKNRKGEKGCTSRVLSCAISIQDDWPINNIEQNEGDRKRITRNDVYCMMQLWKTIIRIVSHGFHSRLQANSSCLFAVGLAVRSPLANLLPRIAFDGVAANP